MEEVLLPAIKVTVASHSFSASIERMMWLLLFIHLIGCITLIDLGIFEPNFYL